MKGVQPGEKVVVGGLGVKFGAIGKVTEIGMKTEESVAPAVVDVVESSAMDVQKEAQLEKVAQVAPIPAAIPAEAQPQQEEKHPPEETRPPDEETSGFPAHPAVNPVASLTPATPTDPVDSATSAAVPEAPEEPEAPEAPEEPTVPAVLDGPEVSFVSSAVTVVHPIAAITPSVSVNELIECN